MNFLGFALAAGGMLVLAEISPMFAVGVTSIILLGEALSHPENFNALTQYIQGTPVPTTTESTGKKK